jgi:hypothetical protein
MISTWVVGFSKHAASVVPVASTPASFGCPPPSSPHAAANASERATKHILDI